MKFDCGETWEERKARRGRGRPWFAWRPVKLGDHDCRWLEYVWMWEELIPCRGWVRHYRSIQDDER